MDTAQFDQFFDGYCPESKLTGNRVKMRLNRYDFYESEATGLQIAISCPGVQATILKKRGTGDFRSTVSHADEVVNGEMLSPQNLDKFPFCSGSSLFQNESALLQYINKLSGEIPKRLDHYKCCIKDELRQTDISNIINLSHNNEKNSRDASFDYCFNYFINKENIVNNDLEKSCLMIGFYLASWGMFRNSFLLGKSSRHYEPLIRFIADAPKEYWSIDINNYQENISEIQDIYTNVKRLITDGETRERTHLTLVTKIMLGIFGCVPAFDTYFINSFNKLFKGSCGFTSMNSKSLICIKDFYDSNRDEIDHLALNTKTRDFSTCELTSTNYTRAKIIDLYGFSKR